MSQSYGSNYNVGPGNYYPAYANQPSFSGGGYPYSVGGPGGGMGGFSYPDPMFGSMQGGGSAMGLDNFSMGGNGFGNTGSPSDNYMDSLLNIGPLQQQVNRMTGGATADPSDPLSYVNNTIDPIMQGVEQSYRDGMSLAQQGKKGNAGSATGANTSSSSSSSSSSSTSQPPSSIPLEDDDSSSSSSSSAGSSGDDSASGDDSSGSTDM